MVKSRVRAAARFYAILAFLGLALPAGPVLAQQPTQAQASAIRSSCQADYRANCAGVPTGGSAALACLRKNAASLSPACRTAVNAIGGSTPAPAPAATMAAPPPPSTSTLPPAAPAPAQPTARADSFPPLSPREELMVLRFACGADYRALCASVQPGQGRAIGCLRANGPSLSERCKGALMRAGGR